MRLSIGFSPCPNDTFIFDALVNGKIDSCGLEWDVVLDDVETLNKWAFEGRLDISKLSFPAFFQNADKYTLLSSGGALGKGVGPLVVGKPGSRQLLEGSRQAVIALPGINTTAHMLFSFAYPEFVNKTYLRFDQIEDAILDGDVDAGVIIHENRFTYQDKGLICLSDLGSYWENKMKLPLPLGAIAIKRMVDKETALQINRLIQNSLAFANEHSADLPGFVKNNAQEMSEKVMRKHIDLYVNDFSMDFGADGRKAIMTLYENFSPELIPGKRQSSSSLFLL